METGTYPSLGFGLARKGDENAVNIKVNVLHFQAELHCT